MKEQACTFGEHDHLVGVVTPAAHPSELPHILILNAGLVHHVGPGRLAIEVSRKLSRFGYACTRFDFSGIGDSDSRESMTDIIASGVADAQAVMDRLEAEWGATRFVLIGICSGARHAHHIAVADKRIVGVIALDGYTMPTKRAEMRKVLEKLSHPGAVISGISRRLSRMFQPSVSPQKSPAVTAGADDPFYPKNLTASEMSSDLEQLLDRNVKLLCIFTGEWDEYVYEGQLADAFPDLKLLRVLSERRLESADHLFFTTPERDQLLEIVAAWLKENFSSSPAGSF